ncbi:transglutaminase domain-containing protein [Streptomyces sp. 7R007]
MSEVPDIWLEALKRLRPVPEEYFRATVDVAEAARQLGVPAETVYGLVEAGLPAEERCGGPRLDYHDVANLGLTAAQGRSLAELAEARMLRMAAGEPSGWTAERTWRLRLAAPCDAEGCPGERPTAPEPELLDGRLLDLTDDGQATVLTRGLGDAPRTAAVSAVYDELLARLDDGTYQFGWLPHRLRETPATAAAYGMVDCRVAAWIMAHRARAAGLEARTRKGFVLGLVGVEHAWTEVFEQDRWLPLDPVLAFLARRHKASHPAFTDFCRGSVHNRLLAWPVAAEEPLVPHACAYGGRVTLTCHQLTTRPAPTSGRV